MDRLFTHIASDYYNKYVYFQIRGRSLKIHMLDYDFNRNMTYFSKPETIGMDDIICKIEHIMEDMGEFVKESPNFLYVFIVKRQDDIMWLRVLTCQKEWIFYADDKKIPKNLK